MVGVACLSIIGLSATARAASVRTLATGASYVAMGDSYTAGDGLPIQLTSTTTPPFVAGCGQSSNSYPYILAARYGLDLNDVSCSGAVTADFSGSQTVTGGSNPPQDDALGAATRLVTIGMGGNDVDFAPLIGACLQAGALGQSCQTPALTSLVSSDLAQLAANLPGDLATIKTDAPNAEIVYTGYPQLLPDEAEWAASGCAAEAPFYPGDIDFLVTYGQEINAVLQQAATAAGAVYVDDATPSIGHDLCQPESTRWIEGLSPAAPATVAFHPNLAGEAAYAANIEAAITPTITSLSPSSGPVGGGTTVTVHGSNLAHAESVRVGPFSVPFTASADGSTITLVTPPGTSGAAPITVTSGGITDPATPAALFTYQSGPTAGSGYTMAGGDGSVVPFGDPSAGSLPGEGVSVDDIAGIARTHQGNGYWLVGADGGVFAFGDARYYGSMGGQRLNAPIVGIAATADDGGYWLVAADGGVFAFGDAVFHGSMGGVALNKPVVGLASDPATGGYWEVATDGGIFAFDAPFQGSLGGVPLNKPVTGMASDPATGGYWEVATDGGIFAFDAPFEGSLGATGLAQPIVAMVPSPSAAGYTLVARDGGAFTFGDAPYLGSLPGSGVATTDIVAATD